MGLYDAVALVILLSLTELSLLVTPTRADAPRDQRTLCESVCVCVSVPTHVSLASLAPRPKSRWPAVSSRFAALHSLETTQTHPRTGSEHPHAPNILYVHIPMVTYGERRRQQ